MLLEMDGNGNFHLMYHWSKQKIWCWKPISFETMETTIIGLGNDVLADTCRCRLAEEKT
jgi:hypothetical protein